MASARKMLEAAGDRVETWLSGPVATEFLLMGGAIVCGVDGGFPGAEEALKVIEKIDANCGRDFLHFGIVPRPKVGDAAPR